MASTNVFNGTLIGVYVGGTLIAKSTSCSLDIQHSTRNSSSKDSGGWEEALGGSRNWTVSGDFLDAEDAAYRFDDLFALIGSRAPVTLKVSSEVSGDKYYTGSAILTSLSKECPMEDNVSGAYSFKGTGALSEATV